ncbi:MAG TPA: ribonuclease III [Opitutaceae bacterium]|nr:ribonuclease III [Opitutaceae bacterium]
MSAPFPSPFTALQARLAYEFRDAALLELAVTHSSFLPDHPETKESYQRLEFLGDAVLQLILTEALFTLFPGDREGSLSKRRAALSKGSFLSWLARDINLADCLRLGASEQATGGRTRASTLEDALEALIGALYLDSDWPTTRRVVLGLYGSIPDHLASVADDDNPKGRLQELMQPRHGNLALRYEVSHIGGEDHAREYEVTVFLLDRALGTGRGPSKKAAEEAAAHTALETLKSAPEN